MPVLYGVFLYMGVAALNSIQVSTDPQRSITLTFLLQFLNVLNVWVEFRGCNIFAQFQL